MISIRLNSSSSTDDPSWCLPASVPLLHAIYAKEQIETMSLVCQCFERHRIYLLYRGDTDRLSISADHLLSSEGVASILYTPILVHRYKRTRVMPYLEKNDRQEISCIHFLRCSHEREPPYCFESEIDCFVVQAKRVSHLQHSQESQALSSTAAWEASIRAYILDRELGLQMLPPLPFPPPCAGARTHYLHPQTERLVYPLPVLNQEPVIPIEEEVILCYMEELIVQLEAKYAQLRIIDREHPITFCSIAFASPHLKGFFQSVEEGLFILQKGKVPTAAFEAFWYECTPLLPQHILSYGYYWCVLQVLGEEKFNQLFSLSSVRLQIGREIDGDFCPLAPLIEKICPTIQGDLMLGEVRIVDICYFHLTSALKNFSFAPEVIGAYALCVGQNADDKPLFSSAACRVPHTEIAFRDWLILSLEQYLHLQKNICAEDVYNHLRVYLEASPYCDLTIYRLNWKALASLQQASDVGKAYFTLLCAQEPESASPPLYYARQRADTTGSDISIINEE